MRLRRMSRLIIMMIPSFLGPGPEMIAKDILAILRVELHDDELAVPQIHQVLKVLDAPMVPLHQETSRHQAMRDQDDDAREILVPELPPEGLIESADAVVGISRGLAVGDTVEKVAIVGPLLPDPFHLRLAWLKVAKVLFAEPRLLVYLDAATLERGRGRVVGCQHLHDSFRGLSRARVWRRVDLDRVVWPEHCPEPFSRFSSLSGAFRREFYAWVRNGLVDFSVYVSFRLRMADQNYHL